MAGLEAKRILFRADSSPLIGTGHVMRSSVLAKVLRELGAEVRFACRKGEGDLLSFLRTQGFAVQEMPSASSVFDPENYDTWLGGGYADDLAAAFGGVSCDLVVIDHYGAGIKWQRGARDFANFVMLLDDEAVRPADCDILLNQNFYPQGDALYKGLVSGSCRSLVGPFFALLREEFATAREQVAVRQGLRRILVTMGGADAGRVAQKIVAAVASDEFELTVIAGNACVAADDLRQVCERKGAAFYQGVANMADHMAQADFCIGAGGSSSWERCCLKLPSALFSLAVNQMPISANLDAAGAAVDLGDPRVYNFEALSGLLSGLRDRPERIRLMSERAGALTDGQGAMRVAREIEALLDR